MGEHIAVERCMLNIFALESPGDVAKKKRSDKLRNVWIFRHVNVRLSFCLLITSTNDASSILAATACSYLSSAPSYHDP
jgi:hypothetical protein